MIKILKYGEVENKDIFARAVSDIDVSGIVSDIIDTVKEKGDSALFMYCEKFDKAKLSSLQVTQEEIDEAIALVPKEFIEILKKAAANIRNFHKKQIRNGFVKSEAKRS